MSKAAVTTAATNLQASLEDLGVKWLAFVNAFSTYRTELYNANPNRQPGDLDNTLSMDRVKSLVILAGRPNGLAYLLEGNMQADGRTVNAGGSRVLPDGDAALATNISNSLSNFA